MRDLLDSHIGRYFRCPCGKDSLPKAGVLLRAASCGFHLQLSCLIPFDEGNYAGDATRANLAISGEYFAKSETISTTGRRPFITGARCQKIEYFRHMMHDEKQKT